MLLCRFVWKHQKESREINAFSQTDLSFTLNDSTANSCSRN